MSDWKWWLCMLALYILIGWHCMCSPAHATTYFAHRADPPRAFESLGAVVPTPIRGCQYTVNGATYPGGLRWDVVAELGDSLDVKLRCWFTDYTRSGWVGAAGGPFVASPPMDPSGDGAWGVRDIGYLRRSGISLMWMWRLRWRSLNERGVWE